MAPSRFVESTSFPTKLGAAGVEVRKGLSDNGNLLMDADFGSIEDPLGLARALSLVPGLLEHGIFPVCRRCCKVELDYSDRDALLSIEPVATNA